MEAVQIVTIKSKSPLFKGNEGANKVELINLEEVGFDLVSGKDIYQIGDKAVFIQPDYCLPDISLFESFIRPNGDESKSMLGKIEGKPRRIRAKKFNLSKDPDGNPVYSNGILLPVTEVQEYCSKKTGNFDLDSLDLTRILEITKYEEPEKANKYGINIGASSKFPEGIYKTDETNIYNQLGKIKFPITLIGTEKIDGSSITIGVKNGEGFICSRNMNKPLFYNKCMGIRKAKWWEKVRQFLTGYTPNLKIYQKVPNDQDDFVKYGKPYLDLLLEKGYSNIILRGELHGGTLKGSGNKNNPARKEKPNIKFFNIDFFTNGFADKVSVVEFDKLSKKLNIPTVKVIFKREFNSFEEIIEECDKYFKDNLIEGIVVKSLDNKFSAKVMCLEYDSKK